MLNHNASRIRETSPKTLSALVTKVAEGALLAIVQENGNAVVRPSTNAATEIFAGFAVSQFMDSTEAPAVQEVTVPTVAPFTVTLRNAPLAPSDATVRGAFVTSGAALDFNATADAAGKFAVSGAVVTFHSADAGKAVRLTYRYALSALDAQLLYGQGIGDGAQSTIGAVGSVIKADVLFTDQYDPAADWTVTGPVRAGAVAGTITIGGTGAIIPNCSVESAPTPANPFVGIRVNI